MDGDTKAILDKLDDVRDAQSETNTKVAGLAATVDISTREHGDQIKALFAGRREHELRLGKIEARYVPREDCRRELDINRVEYREINQNLDDQGTFRGKLIGGALVIGMLASALVAWALGKV